MKKLLYVFSSLLLLTLVWVAGAQAIEDDYSAGERERKLEHIIEQMQEKMEQLESEVNELKGVEDPSALLEERIESLEQDHSYWFQPDTFRVYWKDRPRFETRDKEFKVEMIGRIMNDWTWQSPNDPLERAFEKGLGENDAFDDGTEFRRARLGLQGAIYDRVIFKSEYDWTNGTSSFKDVWMGVNKIPYVGTIMVGHAKEDFGLEELTSSKHITFLERSYTDIFAPGRNTGLRLTNSLLDDHMQWAVGVFRDTDDFGNSDDESGDGEYNVTGRLTGTPWYENKGEKLVHLGLSYSRRSPHDDEVRYRARPLVHQTTRLVDTDNDPDLIDNQPSAGEEILSNVDKIHLVGPELAFVYGPFSLQGEYALASNDVKGKQDIFDNNGNFIAQKDRDHADFNAWYVYGSYFLTGEHRAYKQSRGKFDNIKVKDNFYDKKTGYGCGAWEIAARWSDIDLQDEGVEGGEMDGITLGLNWYLNSNARVMLNWSKQDLERDILYYDPPGAQGWPDREDNEGIKKFKDGKYDALTLRFQIHW